MKKIIAALLSLTLLFSTNTTVFAYEPQTQSGETEIKANAYSSFEVTIPANIDFSNMPQAEITVTMCNLSDEDTIQVSVTNLNEFGFLTLTHDTKPNTTANFCLVNLQENTNVSSSFPILATFNNESMASRGITEYFSGDFAEMATAGHYTGTMTYHIECVSTQP